MALTASTMLNLGTVAPDFNLPDVRTGEMISHEKFVANMGLLVMFICRHCPYVKHMEEELAQIGHDFVPRGFGVVAISSNDVEQYPDDAPHMLKEMAERLKFNFPFCYDESQSVARAYHAVCTPDFFLFDGARRLVYRGQFDGSRPGNGVAVTGQDLRAAMEALAGGKPIAEQQTPSLGCNIKWK